MSNLNWKWSLLKGITIFGMILAVVWIIHISAPTILISFSLSLLTITLGVILDSRENNMRKFLKFFLYILFFLYSLYLLGFFENIGVLNQLNPLEASTLLMALGTAILFSIIAPLCMAIVGRQITSIRIKGHKIFTYGIWWMIYLFLVFVWKFFLPEQVILEFLLLFFIISLLLVYYFNNKKEKEW